MKWKINKKIHSYTGTWTTSSGSATGNWKSRLSNTFCGPFAARTSSFGCAVCQRCVCTYICIYVHTHTRTYTHMHRFVCLCVRVCVCMQQRRILLDALCANGVCVRACVCVCVFVHVYAYMYILHMYIYVHTCVFVYIQVLHFHAIRLTNSAAHLWGYRPYVAQVSKIHTL